MNRPLHIHAHTIHAKQHHYVWDNSIPPVLTVAPGEVVEFQDIDVTSGQLSPESTVDDVAKMDFSFVNPLSGPVYIDGAEPGERGRHRRRRPVGRT